MSIIKFFLIAAILLIISLFPRVAAAENIIGTITLTSAASKNNQETAVTFKITNPRVTVQCTVAMWICQDLQTCSATTGYQVAAEPIGYPTYLNGIQNVGGVMTMVISIFPVSGSSGACRVYTRDGRELTWYNFPSVEEYIG